MKIENEKVYDCVNHLRVYYPRSCKDLAKNRDTAVIDCAGDKNKRQTFFNGIDVIDV